MIRFGGAPSPLPAPGSLRIVQAVTRRQLRGAEVFAGQLSEALAARGHQVAYVSLYPGAEDGPEPPGSMIVDLAGRRGRGLSPRLVISLIRFLRSWRPSIVQANGSDTLKYLALSRRLSRSRAPLVYRNISIASAWLRGPAHRAANRWLAHRADAVAAVSPAAASDYAETYGVPRERIVSIPIGTHVPETIDRREARRRLAEILGRAPEGTVVLHAGSFTPEKDHDLLIRAFVPLAEARPDALLVLAGDGPGRKKVEALAAASGLAGRIVCVGARSDLSDWMAGADLFVLSSRIEGLPGVILEAAARGLPVVATAVGSVPDVVLDGRTGLLVPPGDRDSLSGALARLLDDLELRTRLGAAGRGHVGAHYHLDGIVDRFEALYRALAGGDFG